MKIFKCWLCFIALNIFFVPSTAWPLSQETQAKIDTIVQRQINANYNVGVVIGIIENGRLTFLKYGKKDFNANVAPDSRSIFEIGSITKVFTGIILADLVRKKLVNIDDPVSKYVPELQGYPAGSITLKQLATHTSGLPRIPDEKYVTPLDPNPYKDFDEKKLLSYLKSLKKITPVEKAAKQNYSNTGFALLGYVLSKATSTPYEKLVQKIITAPLRMSDTVVSLSAKQRSRFLNGYNQAIEVTSHWDMPLAGMGGLHSTANDLIKFVIANMVVVTKSSVTKLLDYSQQVQVVGANESVGLGWMLDGKGDNQVVWHNGTTGGFSSLIAFNEHKHLGLVILTNTANAIPCVYQLIFDKECKGYQPEYVISPQELATFVGAYQLHSSALIKITQRLNFLVAQPTGQQKFRMKAINANTFEIDGGLAKIVFEKDANGEVNQLILKQDGKSIVGKRVEMD